MFLACSGLFFPLIPAACHPRSPPQRQPIVYRRLHRSQGYTSPQRPPLAFNVQGSTFKVQGSISALSHWMLDACCAVAAGRRPVGCWLLDVPDAVKEVGREGVGPTECHVSLGCYSSRRVRWLLEQAGASSDLLTLLRRWPSGVPQEMPRVPSDCCQPGRRLATKPRSLGWRLVEAAIVHDLKAFCTPAKEGIRLRGEFRKYRLQFRGDGPL